MRGWIAWGLMGMCGAATAGQADVCYSKPVPSEKADKLTSATTLECPLAGRHTLAQLAEAGWAVASVQPVATDYGVDPATQAPHSDVAWMLVIQKETR